MPIEQATISPMDRGFLFGDGVYEVMARVDGRIRAKSLHKARLQSSLDAIGLSVSVDDVFTDVDRLTEKAGLSMQKFIYKSPEEQSRLVITHFHQNLTDCFFNNQRIRSSLTKASDSDRTSRYSLASQFHQIGLVAWQCTFNARSSRQRCSRGNFAS